MPHRATRTVGVLTLVLALGCGGGAMPVVSGTVTLDGQPVANGSISFVPLDGKGRTAGGTITDGKYSTKVPVGEMKVSISVPKIVGREKEFDTPDSPTRDVAKESAPEKYNSKSELKLTVGPGDTVHDFVLSTK
jgi:hypothetical protein